MSQGLDTSLTDSYASQFLRYKLSPGQNRTTISSLTPASVKETFLSSLIVMKIMRMKTMVLKPSLMLWGLTIHTKPSNLLD